MVEFRARHHRLEIPPAPNSDDPAVQKKYSNDLRRLVMDEFNRLASDFYDFKQATYNAAIIPLRGVANIVITRDQYTMSATWENPDGQDVVPTHVRVRIKEITPNSWATYSYPKSSWSFSGLNPNTQYTLEIQLIAEFEATDTFVSTTRNCPSVPVLRTAESDIKAKVFTTLAGVGPPTVTPTNDTNVTFDFPTTVGTPGAVDSANCWWGYKFQYRASCAWADTAVSESFAAGNVGNVPLDFATTPFTTHPNAVFRIAYREICNAVPGAWVFGNPFMAVDYSDADCFGIAKSASLTAAPYSSADIYALPSVCQASGTGLQIVDALTDIQFQPAEPGFRCIEYISGEWTLLGDDTSNPSISNTIYQTLLTGNLSTIAALNSESDFSICFSIKVQNNALAVAGGTGPYSVIDLGGKIKARVIQNTSSYRIDVQVPREGGGAYVFSSEPIAYGLWVQIFYTHDTSEPDGRILYVNGAVAAQSSNAIANDFDNITNAMKMSTFNNTEVRQVYSWGRALDPSEIPGGPFNPFFYTETGSPVTREVEIGDVILVSRHEVGLNVNASQPSTFGLGSWTELSKFEFDPPGVGTTWHGLWGMVTTSGGTISFTSDGYLWAILRGLDTTSGLTSSVQRAGETASFVAAVDIPRAVNGSGTRSLGFVSAGSDTTEPSPPTISTTGAELGVFGHTIRGTQWAQSAGVILPQNSAGIAGQWNGLIPGGGGGFLVNTRRPADSAFNAYAMLQAVSAVAITAGATTRNTTIPTALAGDIIVIAVMGRSTLTTPSGFTKVVEQIAPTPDAPNASVIGRVAIFAALEGTDGTFSGDTITVTQASAGRMIVRSFVIRGVDGAVSKTPIDTVSATFKTAATGSETVHGMTSISPGVNGAGVAILVHTCITAASEGSAPNFTVSTVNADTRGFIGHRGGVTEAFVPNPTDAAGGSTHCSASVCAIFVGS